MVPGIHAARLFAERIGAIAESLGWDEALRRVRLRDRDAAALYVRGRLHPSTPQQLRRAFDEVAAMPPRVRYTAVRTLAVNVGMERFVAMLRTLADGPRPDLPVGLSQPVADVVEDVDARLAATLRRFP